MRSTLAAAAALLFVSNAAPAAESTSLAVKAGFLLGHAQRCGVAAERVDRVADVIQKLMAATAEDAQEQETAGHRFALIFLATAYADKDGGTPIPECPIVVKQFERLEHHGHTVAAK